MTRDDIVHMALEAGLPYMERADAFERFAARIIAAEHELVVDALRSVEALEAQIFRLRGWDSPSDAELDAFNAEHEHLFHDDDVWAYERAFERWLLKRNA